MTGVGMPQLGGQQNFCPVSTGRRLVIERTA